MSAGSSVTTMTLPLVTGPIRAYFAPVNRSSEAPTIFDPATTVLSPGATPSAPWLDLGWVTEFTRTSETAIAEIAAGLPSVPVAQAFTKLAASVALKFTAWSKLGMALATASQHMNVLAAPSVSDPIASGAKAVAAVSLEATSSATVLYLCAQAGSGLAAGDIVVVDLDYTGQVGYVGSAASGGYVTSATAVGSDPDYIRRVSFNTGRIVAVRPDGGLQLGSPLLAGTPTGEMKVQQVLGFVDREGGNFLQEWSAAFVAEGTQGEKIVFYYPRLQPVQGAQESSQVLDNGLYLMQPAARFRALPLVDENDGAASLCYRVFIPASFTAI